MQGKLRSFLGMRVVEQISFLISTAGGTGAIPELIAHRFPRVRIVMRGTGAGFIGTLWGFLFAWYCVVPGLQSLLWIVIGALIGGFSAHVTEKTLQRKDDSRIIVDEIVGFWLATSLLPRKLPLFLAAFIVFRIFDVMKGPWGRWAEGFPGGIGVMADDLLAGGITLSLMIPLGYFLS